MDYRFTAILIILLCLLAIFVRPAHHTPLKLDKKDYILPKPKPKIKVKNSHILTQEVFDR